MILFLFFVFFIFYNLNWGAPFYFHPDERNIASSISQLRFPENLNPNFFAYGSFPIYSIYLVGVIANFLSRSSNVSSVNFQDAILISRYFSAIFSLLSVFMIYKISKDLGGKSVALFAFFLSITSVAFLQFSHFGTFEMWLSFFSLLLFYSFYIFLKTKKEIFLIFGSIVLGLIIGIKLSSLVLLLIPFYSLLILQLGKRFSFHKIKETLRLMSIISFLTIFFYFLSSPYNLIDTESFINSIKYESSVAMGTLSVFYTGSFYNTLPIFFQFQKILPFLINPLSTAISALAIIYTFFLCINKRNPYLGLLLISFLTLFIFHSFLFAKWTRYIIPSLPFLFIIISIFIVSLYKIMPKKIWLILVCLILAFSLFFSFSFLKTVRFSTDSRIEALEFARKNIPQGSQILSEVYDLGITPFNSYFSNIALFNFYELENDPSKKPELESLIKKTDYIILPSQRILKSRIANNNNFSQGYNFYSNLLSGKLGFKKIYETPCDAFCKIAYLGNPISNVEETVNVFDRPTMFIFFKK